MQIVDEEYDRAAGYSWRSSWRRGCVVYDAEGFELLFTRAAGGDALEERDRTRLSIDNQLKLFALSPSTNLPFLSRTVTAVWTSSTSVRTTSGCWAVAGSPPARKTKKIKNNFISFTQVYLAAAHTDLKTRIKVFAPTLVAPAPSGGARPGAPSTTALLPALRVRVVGRARR